MKGLFNIRNGDIIPAAKCQEIANLLDEHVPNLPDAEDREWLKDHAKLWRTCGGYYCF